MNASRKKIIPRLSPAAAITPPDSDSASAIARDGLHRFDGDWVAVIELC